MKLKALFNEYKVRIIFLMVFVFLTVVFPYTQKKYYMADTVSHFEDAYLWPILLWVWIGLSVIGIIYALVKIRPFAEALKGILSAVITCAFIFFITRGFFLGVALLVNRAIVTPVQQERYSVYFDSERRGKPDYLHLRHVKTGELVHDGLLPERIYYTGLRSGDTIPVTFRKGLLGIVLPPVAK